MDVSATKEFSIIHGRQPVRNQVCVYWLSGRCNRNPCRFMHRESPPPHDEQPQLPQLGNGRMQYGKRTWKSSNYCVPQTGAISNNKQKIPNSTKSTVRQKPFAKTGRKIYDMDQEVNGAISNKKQKIPNSTKSTFLQKTVSKTGRKIDEMDQETGIPANGDIHMQLKTMTAEIAEPGKSCGEKSQLKQCKDWVTGNCVYGDKCKNLHSWFHGCGFTMLAKLGGHSKDISGISLPSGCDKLYSSAKDGSVRVWDCNSGQCAAAVNMDGQVGCLITEGPWLFVGLPNIVKLWNLENHVEICLRGANGLVCCMVVDEGMLFAGIEDGTILVWRLSPEINCPEPAAILKEHHGAICSLVVGANRLYSGSRDCSIKVWDLQNFQCLQTLNGHTNNVMAVLCWDCYLLSASLDKTLKVWSATESGAIEVVYEVKEEYGAIAMCGIHDAEAKPILLCSYNDNSVRLFDLPSFNERGRIFSKKEAYVIQIGIDGLFFTGDASGEIFVWKLLGAPSATSSA